MVIVDTTNTGTIVLECVVELVQDFRTSGLQNFRTSELQDFRGLATLLEPCCHNDGWPLADHSLSERFDDFCLRWT